MSNKILFKTDGVTSGRYLNVLKTIEKGKADSLQADTFALDYGFKKKPITKGLKTEFSLMTDSGGGASGGLSFIDGTFGKGDTEQYVKGSYDFKASRLILEWQRHQEQFYGGERTAYASPKKKQFDTKVRHHKNLMGMMNATDGTGRICSPYQLEGASSGATIVRPFEPSVNYMPIRMNVAEPGNGLFGSISYLFDSLVISFLGCCYDDNNDGVAELTDSNFIPRLLMIGFREENTADDYTYWDAFRIHDVDVYQNEVFLLPARNSSYGASKVEEYSKNTDGYSNVWCNHSNNPANGLEMVPAWGLSTDRTESTYPAHGATISAGWEGFFDPASAYSDITLTGKPYLFHPGFVVDSYGKMREAMGVGWTINTDLGKINPYWSTGIRALLENRHNTVHNIIRPRVMTYLPTFVDGKGAEFSFKMFKSLLDRHATRNRNMKKKNSKGDPKKIPSNVIPINTLVYSGLVDLVQANKMFTTSDDVVFGEGLEGLVINYSGQKYKLVSDPNMPEDFIPIVPERSLTSLGGEIKDVTVGGSSEFLKINPDIAERINVTQKYKSVTHENICEVPRSSAVMTNFTRPASF